MKSNANVSVRKKNGAGAMRETATKTSTAKKNRNGKRTNSAAHGANQRPTRALTTGWTA